MIRFALRQFRTQGLVAAGALVILAIVAAVTGPHLVHLYDTTVVGCQKVGDCGTAQAALAAADGHLQSWLGALVLVVPGVLGIFWGAPLIARELETGTFRLVWTQSVTRMRWLAVKLAIVGLAAMVVAGLTSLIVTWWSSPIDKANGYPFVMMFDRRDIVPIAYAAFAFALGAAIGLVVRRTLPAMAATLVAFVGVRLAVVLWVRPRLASPLRLISPMQLPPGGGSISVGAGLDPGDWALSAQTINRAGRVVDKNGLFGIQVTPGGRVTLSDGQSCPAPAHAGANGASPGSPPNIVSECIARLRLREVVTYQPASRYWPFQWEESAIFLVLAVLLVGFCFWWVRRNYTGRGGGPLRRREPAATRAPTWPGEPPAGDQRVRRAAIRL